MELLLTLTAGYCFKAKCQRNNTHKPLEWRLLEDLHAKVKGQKTILVSNANHSHVHDGLYDWYSKHC